MGRQRQVKHAIDTELFNHCQYAAREIGVAEAAIEQQVRSFISRCQEERTEARREALTVAREDQGRSGRRIQASPFVLTYRLRNSLELYWVEVRYSRQGGRHFVRVPTKPSGHPDIRVLLAKSLPQEEAIIRQHEAEARRWRALWTLYTKARRALNSLIDGVEVVP